MNDLLIADGHVHVHGFPSRLFLDTAADNLGKAAAGLQQDPHGRLCYLLLTETVSENFFERAREASGGWRGWRIRRTAEPESLLAEDEAGRRLVLVAGRQVTTRRRLEVLAIGTLRRFASGMAIHEALDAILDSARLAVIPWGFGKWLGSRGRVVEQELRRVGSPRLFLGDNGGRLRWTPRPRLMARAEAAGVRVLPGSDPLPFSDQLRKVGQAGFATRGSVDLEKPLAALVDALASGAALRPFRAGERTHRFVLAQIRMQIHQLS